MAGLPDVPKYRLTKAAADDLVAIYLDGLARFGLPQADRYHGGLRQTFTFLAENPFAARLREEICPPIRAYPFNLHIVIYECAEDGIVILRVRHGREDWISSPEG
jgi:toxin ParE1/3/4